MADERWADRPWWLKRPQPRFGVGRSLRAAMHLRGGFVVSASTDALDHVACLTPPTRELRRYREGRWEIRTEI